MNEKRRYEEVEVSYTRAYHMVGEPGWCRICETRYSDFYWNELTGELLRIPNDGDGNPVHTKLASEEES